MGNTRLITFEGVYCEPADRQSSSHQRTASEPKALRVLAVRSVWQPNTEALNMISSHDDKLVAVMRAVLLLPIEQRNVVLRYIARRLRIYGTGYFDIDFDKSMRVVVRELILRMALQDLAQTFEQHL
jgi:hypothetical protein